ncbi:hypothetical protein FORC065_2706 [Yersinia enterocolitica]|nr:hypothetical protein FORC065_2706 [Yersinia enterocolitica]
MIVLVYLLVNHLRGVIHSYRRAVDDSCKTQCGIIGRRGILGYFGADWQSKTLLITAGVALFTGVVLSAFTDRDCR